ncbi:Dabb family protein [Horticoccus luteus]|uniref:Dabb family protein n=1 Tax=Horticoccus luteus TaxID=2862869 RepID=A0A8F9XG84_9BACT|nr:Dabb family protein [Horticoccus luteus]QYM77950.1 Dabb family protein [Horticoccus luteus]
MLVHTVYFWLKSDLTAAQREAFAAALASLRGIPMEAFYTGRPAALPARPVVDATFDHAITCVFADIAAHNVYQTHPLHLAFLAQCKTWWTRVQIYDAN